LGKRRLQAVLNKRIKEIAGTRVRYGYRRIHVLLRREGWRANAKRVRRLYREMGLQLPSKTPNPYSPDSIAAEFAGTLKAYGLGTVTGDAYGAEWTTERFGAHGVIYQPSELNRSEIYLNFLPAVTSGQVGLLDNRKMVARFAQLERRTSRAGRDTIDHPSGGHDDVSNAVAGCITLPAVKKQFPAHGDNRCGLRGTARRAIPDKAEPREAEQHHRPSRGLGHRSSGRE
jgi:hypothetical protein